MKKKHVGALNLKPGPTESGGPPQPVGGELLPSAVSALSQYWILIILLLLPLFILFYKKRNILLPWVMRLLTR
ncbi:MAG: hypothetical protein QXD82_01200 [Nitrososphaerales archaeon]